MTALQCAKSEKTKIALHCISNRGNTGSVADYPERSFPLLPFMKKKDDFKISALVTTGRYFGAWIHIFLWSLNPSMNATSMLQCNKSLSIPSSV